MENLCSPNHAFCHPCDPAECVRRLTGGLAAPVWCATYMRPCITVPALTFAMVLGALAPHIGAPADDWDNEHREWFVPGVSQYERRATWRCGIDLYQTGFRGFDGRAIHLHAHAGGYPSGPSTHEFWALNTDLLGGIPFKPLDVAVTEVVAWLRAQGRPLLSDQRKAVA